jgi:imidazolonepropionase-like amidohydrolase
LRGTLILAVGPSSKVKIPRDAKVIDCRGLFIVGGFVDWPIRAA